MASLVLNGDTSGSITVSAPSVAGSNTVSLPANTGTAILDYSTPAYRNRIINGAMGIWQRGTTFSSPASGAYTADRFFIVWSGAAPTVSQTTGPTGYKYALQITGAVGNTLTSLYQRIESVNCSDLSGATVTIQVNLQVSTAQTVTWVLYYPTATDNYASATLISNGSWSATTTAGVYTATITNLPSGVTNGLQLIIGANNNGAFTSGTLNITGVQLEKGSTATSFDYRPYGTELALCQRYYARMTASDAFETLAIGQVGSATAVVIYAKLPVSMRAQPTINYSTLRLDDGSVTPAVTSLGTNRSGVDNISQTFNASGGGMTLGRAGMLEANNSTSAYIDATAEL